ncbi:MAG: TIGR04282 family arsenosugar biosynthesis glycosyltransferase [Bdellovibrionales bacterium]
MSTALAIFVKTPDISPLKTRLAETIGTDAAHDFYKLSLKSIETTAAKINITPYWAVAENDQTNHPLWQNFTAIHTGEGDLGARQHHIYQTLLSKHDKVLLIGADAPQISEHHIQSAIEALNKHDFVIGPANDGGYYLFGGHNPTPAEIWANITWSAETTRAELEQNLPSPPAYLSTLTDVDTEKDLHIVHKEMSDDINKYQKQLMTWIEQL